MALDHMAGYLNLPKAQEVLDTVVFENPSIADGLGRLCPPVHASAASESDRSQKSLSWKILNGAEELKQPAPENIGKIVPTKTR